MIFDRELRTAVASAETVAWFGFQLTPSTFGIFDVFADKSGRAAHLSGRIAAALGQKAGELLATPPVIERAGRARRQAAGRRVTAAREITSNSGQYGAAGQ
jgi:hypothetical protein